jgi:hypothetical protein
VNSLVNSMCADRGGGLNEMKKLLDRHTQTSVGQPEVHIFPDLHSDRVLNVRWFATRPPI